MGHKRWLQIGIAFVVAGVLIVGCGTSAAYNDLSAAWARGSLDERATMQAAESVRLWRSVGGFASGIGVIAVAMSLCFRWLVKPVKPPDHP